MMKTFNFRPKLLPTLFTIPALCLLFFLSGWQFQRLVWKENLISQIENKIRYPAINLPEQFNLDEMLYRKVKIIGNFLNDKEMFMYGGSIEFKGKNGYYILTPFRSNKGEIIIINRGWVPEDIKDISKRPDTIINQEVEITGTIMKTEEKGLYIHDNQPEKNLWFYINLDEIRSYLQLPIKNFYILQEYKPNTFPVGRNVTANLRNNHLGYALTWGFAAISLIVIYILYHKKNK